METQAVYSFPFGQLQVGTTNGKVVILKKVDHPVKMGQRTPLTERVAAQVDEYLTGKRFQFDFPYKLHGTAFQLAV